jgi:LacI family transcriptional regulator
MLFSIDNNSPKYQTLKNMLIKKICSGEFQNGSFLPPEKNLARTFQVSRSTVRNALKELRSDGIISTRQGQPSKVCRAALDRDYQVQRKKIAWIDCADIREENPIYFEIFKATSFYAEQQNLQLNFISLNDPAIVENFFFNSSSYAGGIVTGIGHHSISQEIYANLANLKNLVCVDNISNSPARHFVGTDNYIGAKEAVEYLLETGHRNIIFLANKTSFYKYYPFCERLRGYKDSLQKYELKIDSDKIIIHDFEDEVNIRPILGDILKKLHKADAIFAVTDNLAIETIFSLKIIGLEVPRDISVIGFDGLSQCQVINPRLSTVQQPCKEIGKIAIQMVSKLIEGHHVTNQLVVPKLLYGESVMKRI